MRLRTKLLAAQAPNALAILVLAAAASAWITTIAGKTDRVLRDNYRSVLAAQRMKDAAWRIDGAASLWILGRRDLAGPQIAAEEPRFESELAVEESNITETGEAEAAGRVRAAWTRYRADAQAWARRPEAELGAAYLATLAPELRAVRDGADEVLAINQEAIVRKSDQAIASATRARTAIIVVGALALLAGFVASSTLTTRLLRPLSVLSQAVRRLGAGDLVARAQLGGSDEIAWLARDFNAMAEHLEQYRRSSLGELLVAQTAAQTVIDSLPDPVIVLGVRGELLAHNEAAQRVLGVDLERGLDAARPEARAALERLWAHVLGGGGAYVPRSLDEAVRVADVHLLPRATPIYGAEGAIDGTTIVLQDVSRLHRVGELKDNLVATVAHELRTPLTSLRMAIHMCAEGAAGELSERQQDLLHVARDDCERLQAIVEELLDLSRIQSGRIELNRRRVGTGSLVQQAAQAHEAAARLAGLALKREVLPGLGAVEVDPDRVQLVFDNLITNALRHTRAGEVVVRALPAGSFVRFEVADTGVGIAPEHQDAIFEKFYRVPGEARGGAGLGLFIAREIARAHGGQIGLTSEVGKGTTFWFTIPAAPEAEA
jgi:signal transduction histidine kinase/HAMP domain-containing protein